VVDLMEALRASVNAARRGENPKSQRASTGKRSKSSGTRRRSSEDLNGLTKQELADRAKKLNITGRSQMDKNDLIRAIKEAS
jgi:hypothetical protein